MTPDPNQQPAEETTERGAPRSPRKKHRPSILGYLIVLFIAAFFLLLLSYFMQQRRSDQNLIDGLQENASAMETVNTLIEQNQALLGLLSRLAEEKQATPAQVSLAWMLCKKPWIVPIPGSRKVERMEENLGAAKVELTRQEVEQIDSALDRMPMSAVFGGTRPSR